MKRGSMLAIPAVAWAHSGEAIQPHDVWSAWSFEPGIVIPLLVSAVLFACGARRRRGVTRARSASFWSGWALLTIALMSPIHPMGEALFSAHMVQHEILMIGAAPLFVMSRPLTPMLWGLPMAARRGLGRWSKGKLVQTGWRAITRSLTAWWIHAAALWVWHAPALFQFTIENEWAHAAQHISFFGSALLFWWSLMGSQRRSSCGAGVLYLFTTAVHTSVLGALLTFAQTLWYPAYRATTAPWGISPLEDQQLGGLIMWIPGGIIYLAAGLWLFARWLRESELALKEGEYAR